MKKAFIQQINVITVSTFSVLGNCFIYEWEATTHKLDLKHFPILFEYVTRFLLKFTTELQQHKTKVANQADSRIRMSLHSLTKDSSGFTDM